MSVTVSPGQCVSHVFNASEMEVRPGWIVPANSRLTFVVEILDQLRDAKIIVPSTDGFDATKLENPWHRIIMTQANWTRRRTDMNWFALVGGIVERGGKLTTGVVRGPSFFPIGAGRNETDPVVVAQGGEFVCFLNDTPARIFYCNNHGKVKLTLTVLG